MSLDAHKVKKMEKCSYRNALFKWTSMTLAMKILSTSTQLSLLVLASCVQAQCGVCWHLSAFLVQAVGHEFLSFCVSGEKKSFCFWKMFLLLKVWVAHFLFSSVTLSFPFFGSHCFWSCHLTCPSACVLFFLSLDGYGGGVVLPHRPLHVSCMGFAENWFIILIKLGNWPLYLQIVLSPPVEAAHTIHWWLWQ